MLVLIVAMYLLVLAPRRPALAQYVSIPLALSFIIRPTAAIPIALISAYVLIYYRRWFGFFILGGSDRHRRDHLQHPDMGFAAAAVLPASCHGRR